MLQLQGHDPSVTPPTLSEFWQLRPTKNQHARQFASKIIHGTRASQEAIDQQIEANLEHYTLKRIGPIEHSILRCATWEMHHSPEPTPVPVVIDQSVEIAQRLAGTEVAKFINGVLDQIAKA